RHEPTVISTIICGRGYTRRDRSGRAHATYDNGGEVLERISLVFILAHSGAFGDCMRDVCRVHNGCRSKLPLQRVLVSNSGLAQSTSPGTADAGDKLELSVRLDQVDDILKSLTVFDREGALGAVTLPGKAPLQELFRDLPFGPEAINSPANLLNAMVGSEIE